MNEPICLARVRKPTKLELKPGDWVIVTSPDGTFSDANGAFDRIPGGVNEEYSRVIIGKITHTRSAKDTFTAKQDEARLSQIEKRNESVSKIVSTALERQRNQAKAETEARQKRQLTERERANEIAENIRKTTGYKPQ